MDRSAWILVGVVGAVLLVAIAIDRRQSDDAPPSDPVTIRTPLPTWTALQHEAAHCAQILLHVEAMEEEGLSDEAIILALMRRFEMSVEEMTLQFRSCNRLIEDGRRQEN